MKFVRLPKKEDAIPFHMRFATNATEARTVVDVRIEASWPLPCMLLEWWLSFFLPCCTLCTPKLPLSFSSQPCPPYPLGSPPRRCPFTCTIKKGTLFLVSCFLWFFVCSFLYASCFLPQSLSASWSQERMEEQRRWGFGYAADIERSDTEGSGSPGLYSRSVQRLYDKQIH